MELARGSGATGKHNRHSDQGKGYGRVPSVEISQRSLRAGPAKARPTGGRIPIDLAEECELRIIRVASHRSAGTGGVEDLADGAT